MKDREKLLIALLSKDDSQAHRHRFSVLEVAAMLDELGAEHRRIEQRRRVVVTARKSRLGVTTTAFRRRAHAVGSPARPSACFGLPRDATGQNDRRFGLRGRHS